MRTFLPPFLPASRIVVLLIAALVPGFCGSVSAQSAIAPEVAIPVPSSPNPATPRQLEWLAASPEQRVKLAEQLGEDGARQLARSKGWQPIVDGTGSTFRQGFDQVYRAADDLIVVVEAKGGVSPLGHAYGHPQASPEWSVKAAEQTIKSPKASAAEKEAAKSVLRAAREGRLRTVVIRTRHVLGEPMAATLESTLSGSDEAARLAGQIIDDLASKGLLAVDEPLGVANDAARRAASMADDAARGAKIAKAGRVAARVAVPIAIGVDVGVRAHEAGEVEDRFEAGEISQQERELAHTTNAAGMVGGWGGALAGAKAGAIAGGAAGSCVAPGPGTTIGAIAGGAAGGIAGYLGGEAAAEAAAEWTVGKIHAGGETISSVASKTWEAGNDAAAAVGEAGSDAVRWTSRSARDAWSWAFGD